MPSTNTSASIAMPSRADEPINTISYYNIIPLEQSDPEHLLCLAIEGNGFEEGQRVILSTQLANGGAHFRLDGSGRWGSYLRSRNSGKMLVPANGYALQMALKDEEAAEAELDLVPAGQHLYRICQKARPHIQARIGSATAGAPLEFTDAAPGTLFYLAPATRFEWIDEGESGARNYQDSTELSLRAAIDGVLGFGGDKISEFTEIPGGAMILQMILPLIWPEKSLNEILEEFRKDLLEDMRRLMASEALVQATNTLLDTRRKYLMQYLDERRMKIDRPSNGLDQVAGSYADTFSQAILRLLPGIIGADGKINPLIAPEYIPLAKAGLNVYMQGAADHICALQERALMAAFNPANVSRFYPRSADRRFLEAGSSDRVRLEAQAPSRQKTLSLVNLVDDTLSHGDQVALKVSNGQYLSAFFGNMGPITAIRKTRGEWETFRIERRAGPGRIQAGDSIVLLCCQGFCVSATNGGGAGLIAGGPRDGREETLILEKPNEGKGEVRSGAAIGLRVVNGQYISAIDGGGQDVLAQSPHLSTWETLSIERISVGNTLRYGNQLAIRRPSDGRFASLATQADGQAPLCTNNGPLSKSSIFTLEGGPLGQELNHGDAFQLRALDGRYITIGSDDYLAGSASAASFHLEMVRGEPAIQPKAAEPTDWIASYADSYLFNIKTIFLFLLMKHYGSIGWKREEIAKVKGFVVTLSDNTLKRTLYRGMEAGPADFKASEARMEDIKNQYQRHLLINGIAVRHYPIFSSNALAEVAAATVTMCDRLRRDPAYSTEFWRRAVVPDRNDWKL